MKTIGVLGLGAQATVDFEIRVHRAAQRHVEPNASLGYPPMVVWHHRRPPVAVKEDLSPVLPLRSDPELLKAAAWLATKADFLVMTSNGAHVFRKELEEASGRPLLSIVDVTLAEVRRRNWRRVGVLGFFGPEVPAYAEPMPGLGLTCELIDQHLQEKLNAAVFRVMEGRETEESRSAVRDAIAALRKKKVDGIIPGCTELPLLLGAEADAPDLVNPAELLADAAVRRAIG